jgi:hypothetical protein
MTTDEKSLYSLISLEDFKAVLGIDDRDDNRPLIIITNDNSKTQIRQFPIYTLFFLSFFYDLIVIKIND